MPNKQLNEYRCTRVSDYPFGTSVYAMQGYYVRTYSVQEALDFLTTDFSIKGYIPSEIHVELWREDLGALFEKQLAEGLIKL